jgi:carboxymethylenebutenolidase
MCDDSTDNDLDALGMISRRDLGVLAASLGVAAAFPAGAASSRLIERDVMVPTPDGKADAFFVAPAKGRHPAVLIWPDVYALRPAFRDMAKRLAGAGYAVLAINPFYRSMKAPIIAPDDPRDASTRAKIAPMRQLLTSDAAIRDSIACFAFLDRQKNVDRKRKGAVTGYCMGGPIAMRAADQMPDRIGAVGSFHGGGLATDKPDSPHLMLPKSKASYLIAIAENDDKANPAEKDKLRAAFDAAGRSAEIEVYAGAMHGWCPPDSRAYNAEQAERAWGRMLALFAKALA